MNLIVEGSKNAQKKEDKTKAYKKLRTKWYERKGHSKTVRSEE